MTGDWRSKASNRPLREPVAEIAAFDDRSTRFATSLVGWCRANLLTLQDDEIDITLTAARRENRG